MKPPFFRFASTGLAALLLALLGSNQACSSAADCDPGQCAAGNQCISDGKETKCRLPCDTQSCPFNHHCQAASPKSFCAPDAHAYTKANGQWGAPCSPTKGIDQNPDCDSAQYFWCYAQSPTDAGAYCTQFGCTSDADCKGGWTCATVNTFPNATTSVRQYGATQKVCRPREHCAPCASDLDCPSAPTKHWCIPGKDGQTFCAPECGGTNNCPKDAQCVDRAEFPAKLCFPNAGLCKGDGSFCSPCRNDTDCASGVCTTSQYSREKYCTAKSGKACVLVSGSLSADCPKPQATDNWKAVGCMTNTTDESVPKDHCYAFVQSGVDARSGQPEYLPGCWTNNDTTRR